MRSILFALAAGLALVASAGAATVPYRTDAELVALATRVVRGRVLDSVVERSPGGTIRTRTRLAVLEDFTGGTDRVITVYELGGVLPDGAAMTVPGAPRYTRGEEVVLCLERAGDGFRTVALAFSAFRVGATAPGATALARMTGDRTLPGRQQAPVEARTLEGFRAVAAGVIGRTSRLVVSAADGASMVAAASAAVEAPYTLLANGVRWREADSGVAINWYRNTLTPSPIVFADTDTEIRTALAAWTNPTGASITLNFAGTKNEAPGPEPEPFCTAANLGSGLLTFGDPRNELPVGVLAIGGGCTDGTTHVVNGHTFQRFTHGFVVMNDTLSGYTTAPNVTRILEHEIGHTIGMGHTCEGDACTQGDAINIMFPACCLAQTPVPPALGPDDLAGLVFIYPLDTQPCSYTFSPATTHVSAMGGEAAIQVTPSRAGCPWTVRSNVAWIVAMEGSSGTTAAPFRVLIEANFGAQTPRTGTLTIGTSTTTIVEAADTDLDGDLLPDSWETFYGFGTTTQPFDENNGGDPDMDGVNNLAEFQAGTHPTGMFRRYLAEGAANAFFSTEVAIYNPTSWPAGLLIRIQPDSGPEIVWHLAIPAGGRRSLLPAFFQTLSPGSFATFIESNRPVVVDRFMHWDATGYGSSLETAVDAPSNTWYLAEGSTSTDFALFYLLQNPASTPTQATVRFLRPAPQAPIERIYTLAPRSRLTIVVDDIAELASTDVSGVITATQPIVVERAMYLSRPGQPFTAGHESAGVTAPATEWFLAEGATGTFFDLFVLLENPGTADAAVEVQYFLPGGVAPITKQYLVRAESRFTIYVDDEQIPAGSGQRPLASVAVSMRVRTTNGVPIIVERSMWWPQPVWYEAHNAPGSTQVGGSWGIAAAYVGGPSNAETYVLIANTDTVPQTALLSLVFEDDSPGGIVQVNLPAQSRTSVPIGATFPQTAGRRFSIGVSSGATGAPLVVERAIYESPGGVTWAAGAAALAMRLPY